jgi:hypothetical protein
MMYIIVEKPPRNSAIFNGRRLRRRPRPKLGCGAGGGGGMMYMNTEAA